MFVALVDSSLILFPFPDYFVRSKNYFLILVNVLVFFLYCSAPKYAKEKESTNNSWVDPVGSAFRFYLIFLMSSILV